MHAALLRRRVVSGRVVGKKGAFFFSLFIRFPLSRFGHVSFVRSFVLVSTVKKSTLTDDNRRASLSIDLVTKRESEKLEEEKQRREN